jgi:hypothetical protein
MMLGRHVYRVHPTEQGWTVTKEGEDHPRSGFPGREEAIAEAVRLAESDEPAKVTVDDGDGTIAEEWLFGSDPVAELGARAFFCTCDDKADDHSQRATSSNGRRGSLVENVRA